MLSDKFYEVLKNEGIVTIVTWGKGEPHIVNEWNSYLIITKDERILIPAGIMQKTEENIRINNKIKMALGSKNVIGFDNYQGTGFVVEGTARFFNSGVEYDMMKEKFPFLTRVLEITVSSLEQML
jgi:predicted pyridoxine 5'-phosphate oxidase superfamily flavin-nucleotide-binding protein